MHMILVEVEDDEATQDWIDEFTNRNLKVRGLYRMPTKFCDCPPEVRREKNHNKKHPGDETSARGEKWGWWIKRCCMKPMRKAVQRPVNLLERAQGKEGWFQDYRIEVIGGGD